MLQVGTSVGLRPLLEKLAPQFERASGHKVVFTFGTSAPLKRRIDAGDEFDVVVLVAPMVEELARQGIVGTVIPVAKSRIGAAVRMGTVKPDLSTNGSLRKALLEAGTIAYSKEGQAGPMMARLIDGLGIAGQMGAKTILEIRPGGAALNVAEGRADIAFTVICEIMPVAGVETVLPLPPELTSHVHFAAGICRGAAQVEIAKRFVGFLTSPEAISAFETYGLEPE